jgi:hypothetical protein
MFDNLLRYIIEKYMKEYYYDISSHTVIYIQDKDENIRTVEQVGKDLDGIEEENEYPKIYDEKIDKCGTQTLLVDKNLVELKLINISGYYKDPKGHERSHILDNEEYNHNNTNNNNIFYFDDHYFDDDENYLPNYSPKYEIFDAKLWKKYNGNYTIKNENGITIDDLMIGFYMIKGSKFDLWHEFFTSLEIKNIYDIGKYKKGLVLSIEFYHG